ncbi:MAG TPA: beta-ketoacyl-ACP synthase III, partial [Acidimicrobiales bacterium]|nr:beta-ketoacyl-ACP synthase III [Acidimicrobiales bacterium]
RTPAATTTGVRIAGCGAALPERRVTNEDLVAFMDTSDAWIVERSGIRERRWAGPDESTRTLAVAAARAALDDGGVTASQVDVVLVATTTPHMPLPSTASQVVADIGANAGAADLNAACAGFVYGSVVAAGLLATGAARTVLLVGADTMTRAIDVTDRSTAVLFADGAGAMVLTAGGTTAPPRPSPVPPGPTPGLVACDLVNDPAGVDLLVIPAGGSARPASADTVAAGEHHLRMEGREVFRRAVRAVEASIGRTLDQAGCGPDDVTLFVPHQANARIVDAVLARTGLDPARTSSTIERYGNTSAASIPVALAESSRDGTVRDGDLVLMCGFGAGLTVGTALWRWGSTATADVPS